MTKGLSRRRAIIRGGCLAASGFLLPDLAALVGFGKSAKAGMELPDASSGWNETLPVPVPKFSFMDSAGRVLTLADYKGTGLVVNFWATWCPPCRAELPTLIALNKKLHGSGIRVLLISVDIDGIKAVAPFYKEHHITDIPMLVDPSSSALNAFESGGIPFTAVIDRAGDVVASLEGAGDWDTKTTEAAIRRIVGPPADAGKKSKSPAVTPA